MVKVYLIDLRYKGIDALFVEKVVGSLYPKAGDVLSESEVKGFPLTFKIITRPATKKEGFLQQFDGIL